MSADQLYRAASQLDRHHDDAALAGVPGKAPTTARLNGRAQTNIIFRVESAEAARELAGAFGGRDGNGVATGADAAVDRAASSSGQPLPGDVRSRFESSLGSDLSSVRVHTGAESADAAKAVGARAYTTGQDIHFGAGQYDPQSAFGVHLLAHEVAHTVQQQGAAAPSRQHKLEVSTPQDGAELEADRAADAMVAGSRCAVAPLAVSVHRRIHRETNDAESFADEGEKEMVQTQKKGLAPALAVSNVRDAAGAQALMNNLQSNEALLQQGVSNKEIDSSTCPTAAMLVNNGKVIADLQLYIGAASSQSVSTSNFQQQYATLLRDFGRIESMFQKYAGGSLKGVTSKASAEDAVEQQATSGGADTSELSSAFSKLAEDPLIKTQLEGVRSQVTSLSGLPEKVQTASSSSSTAMGKVSAAVMTLRSATNQQVSADLKAQFAAASKKCAATEGLAGKVLGALQGGAEKGYATATETGTQTGQWGLQFEKAAAGFGGEAAMAALGTGGMALAGVGVGVLWSVLEPMVDKLMQEMDISVGKFPDNRDKAAEAKQDAAIYEAAQAAAETLRLERASVKDSFKAYFSAAKDLENGKKQLKSKMELLGKSLAEQAKKKGMGGVGKQLAEMTTFVGEGQAFAVQAQTVEKIGSQELDASKADTHTAVASERLTEFNRGGGRQVYMAYKYTGYKAGGPPGNQDAEHVGASPLSVSIDCSTNDKDFEKKSGQTSADGDNGANAVIAEAVVSVKDMMVKADGYVKAVNELIFSNALSPS